MPSPSEVLIAEATRPLEAATADGHALRLKQVGALDRLRLFKALGPELSQNAAYLGMALLAASVIEIDGVPVPPPVSEGQVEALVHRLGNDGIAAVAAALGQAPEIDEGN